MRESMSSGIPTPVSLTRRTTSSPSWATTTLMCPSGGVYLAALFNTLTMICSSRAGSASTYSGRGGRVTDTTCRRSSTSGRVASSARSTASAIESTTERRLDPVSG